jgi:hypothetical protein
MNPSNSVNSSNILMSHPDHAGCKAGVDSGAPGDFSSGNTARSGSGARVSAPAGDVSRRAGPGLVSTETSDTQTRIFRDKSRLKRMKRSVLTSARLVQEELQRSKWVGRIAMLTLTYRPEADWETGQITQ